ncbi:MAG TPA: NUDIX domain-containing protein [Candidatus Paceibacterota bacterium]
MKEGVDYTGISVVFACHDGKGNYLHAKRGSNCRDEQGTWDIGGGGIDVHDTVEGTLRKEIREEYCTEVLEYEFLGYRDVHREHGGEKTHWIALDFKVLIDPSTVQNGEPHKMDKIAWFRLDQLPEPLHSQYPYFLEKHKDSLL